MGCEVSLGRGRTIVSMGMDLLMILFLLML